MDCSACLSCGMVVLLIIENRSLAKEKNDKKLMKAAKRLKEQLDARICYTSFS